MKSLGLRSLAVIGAIIAVTIGLLLTPSGNPVQAGHAGIDPHTTTFKITGEYFLCNRLPADFAGSVESSLLGDPSCDEKSAAFSSNPDFSYEWSFPSGSTNFAFLAVHQSDSFSVAADADIADGTPMGGLRAQSTLGLLNTTCSNSVQPDFIFYDATTDLSDTVPTQAEGTTDRFSTLVTNPADDADGIADADSPGIIHWPTFLSNIVDPDRDNAGSNGPVGPISPWARYTGFSQVPAQADWIHLSILVFRNADLAPFAAYAGNATHPLAGIANNSSLGWTYLSVLQDPSAEVASVSSITDFCTQLITTAAFLGDPPGAGVRLTAPSDATGSIDGEGTELVQTQAIGLRDWDGDSFENTLDTCPFQANTENPRITPGADVWLQQVLGDMIDPVCDPDPNVAEGIAGKDFDSDNFQNAQDNCPQVSNATQVESEGASNTYAAAAPDGGPKTDGIGDACDGVTNVNWNPTGAGNANVADGDFFFAWSTGAACIGDQTDSEPNGFPDIDNDGDGWCALSPGADPNDEDAASTGACLQDADSDGYSDCAEAGNGLPGTDPASILGIGTDPNTKCGGGFSHDGWASDMNQGGSVNLSDVSGPFKPHFGVVAVDTSPADGIFDNLGEDQGDYNPRMDLNNSGSINLSDISGPFKPDFGKTDCLP